MNNLNDDSAAYRGRQMASLVRAHHSGVRVDAMEVWDAFQHMMEGDASTAADALALVSTARLLLGEPLVNMPAPEDTESFALHCIAVLLERASRALELETGIEEDAFRGRSHPLACIQ